MECMCSGLRHVSAHLLASKLGVNSVCGQVIIPGGCTSKGLVQLLSEFGVLFELSDSGLHTRRGCGPSPIRPHPSMRRSAERGSAADLTSLGAMKARYSGLSSLGVDGICGCRGRSRCSSLVVVVVVVIDVCSYGQTIILVRLVFVKLTCFQHGFSFKTRSPGCAWRWHTHCCAGNLLLRLSVTIRDHDSRS